MDMMEMEMKQKRLDEYSDLMTEIQIPPAALDDKVEEALGRARKTRRRSFFALPAGGFAAVLCSFIVMVNSSLGFALAVGNLPVIGGLARAVAFSPSLKTALEHDYVQVVGEKQTVDGITMTLEYIIADKKQVNIFYTVKGMNQEYSGRPSVYPASDPASESEEMEFGLQSVSSGGSRPEEGEMDVVTLLFSDQTPEAFRFEYEMELLNQQEPTVVRASDKEELPRFSFLVTVDPQFIAAGERVQLDKWVEVDGQKIWFSDMEIYPTHVRVNVEPDENNTAILKGLSLSIEEADGTVSGAIQNGVTAMGNEDGEMISFHINSNYFSQNSRFVLLVEGAEWLDKKRQKVEIDLISAAAKDLLPESVQLNNVEKKPSGGWLLCFTADKREQTGGMYSIFNWEYEDGLGRQYHFDTQSSTFGDDERRFTTTLEIEEVEGGIAILYPIYSHRTILAEPVVLEVSR